MLTIQLQIAHLPGLVIAVPLAKSWNRLIQLMAEDSSIEFDFSVLRMTHPGHSGIERTSALHFA